MRAVQCPITPERLNHLYTEQKLVDQEIVDILNAEGHEVEATLKRVRSWRRRFGIQTLKRWERYEVPPIEGRLQSLLVGSMLGDGRIAFRGTGSAFSEYHCTAQRPYLDWKRDLWGPQWCPGEPLPVGEGARFGTVTHGSLNPWRDLFYEERDVGWKRPVPEVVELVDSFALAVWYLDDGGAGWWPGICFGAEGGSKAVAGEIFQNFGLSPHWHRNKRRRATGYFEFRGEGQAERFLDIIRPHVPECMRHKLQCDFQGKHYQIRAKLTEEVLLDYAERGVPIKRIARELGVGATTVGRYLDKFEIPHPRLRGNPNHRG